MIGLDPKTPHDLKAVLLERRKALAATLQQKRQALVMLEREVASTRAAVDTIDGALQELEKVIGQVEMLLAATAPVTPSAGA